MARSIFDMEIEGEHAPYGCNLESLFPRVLTKEMRLGNVDHVTPEGHRVVFKDVVVKPTSKPGIVEVTCLLSPEHESFLLGYSTVIIPLDGGEEDHGDEKA